MSMPVDPDNTNTHETPPSETVGPFTVLKLPSAAWFLSGTTLSNAAQWIQQVTLSWLVYDLTSSGAMLGTLNLVRSVATIGLAPLAGVAIDRLSRRGLLYGTAGWLFVISLGFALALLGNPGIVWPLFLFSFLGGIGQAFSLPLRQTVIFSVAPRHLAPNGVALMQTGWAVMRSIGPAIGGYLLVWVGPAGNFFVQAGAYALVILTIIKLTLPYEERDLSKQETRAGFREGVSFVLSNRTTLAFLLISWTLPLIIIPNFGALPPIFAKDVFAGGPDTLGMILSAVGIGGIGGGLVTASLGKQDRRGLLQLVALFLLGLSLLGFALSPTLIAALIAMVLAGFFEMVFLTINMTLLQLSIPDDLRGRVTGIISLRSGLMPVGAFVAGIGSDLIGPRAISSVLATLVCLVAIFAYLASPTIRDYRMSQALEPTNKR